MSNIDELIRRAKELGQEFIAITDHGTMAGHLTFEKACNKHGVKPVLGCEFYMSKGEACKEDSGYHLIVFAKNEVGLRNLHKLQARAYKENYYRKPHINFDMLRDLKEGLVVTSACIGGIIGQLTLTNPLEAKLEAQRYKSEFGEDFYLEIQPNDISDQWVMNKNIIKIAQELNIKVVSTNDVHYVYKEDADVHEVLLAMQVKQKMDDEKRFKFPTRDYWCKSKEEMYETFVGYNEQELLVIRDSIELIPCEIANKCNAKVIKGHFLPSYPKLNGMSEDDFLAEKTWEGFERKYPPSYPNRGEIRKEVMNELQVISDEGYSGYFINVADYIVDARKNGVLVSDGRGSGCGSKVVYCMDITNVDPVPHNLLFERFMAHGRTPDIDADFSNQEHVFKHLQDLHGMDNVARIATYGTLSCKNVVRKIMGTFNFSQKEIAVVNGSLPKNLDVTVEQSYRESKTFKDFMDNNEFIARCIRRLEGTISHEGKHAGGFVVYNNLTELTPCKYENDTKGVRCIPVVQFDKKQIEEIGMYKMDVLGLENLTTVRYALDMIEENEGVKIDLDAIDFNDKNVYEMLCNADVSGVFQLSNQGKITTEAKPKSFSDLIALNAIIRPGCTQLQEYIDRSNGKKWTDYEERLPYTSDTYGLIVYQEQFLLDCKTYANWDIAFADNNTRKNKRIKDDIELRNKFISDSVNNGYDACIVEGIWEQIVDACTSYNFNKSHATAYAVLSFKTAWLKYYYPTYWYASLLNSEIADQDKVEGLVAECKKKGIKILPPDVNKGSYKFEGTRNGIRIPINYLKGVGEDVVKYIQKELVPITSFEDMLNRGIKKYIKKNVVIAMIKAGIFDFENEDRSYFMWLFDMRNRKKTDIKNGIECPKYEYDDRIKLQWEKDVYGMYLSAHPLDTRNARSIHDFIEGESAVQVIEKREVIERLQRNGKPFAFLMGSNQHGTLKCMIFANLWEEEDIRNIVNNNDYLLVKGKKSGNDLIVNDVEGIVI